MVHQLTQDVLWSDHSRVVVRSDNEPALLQVVENTLAALKSAGLESAAGEGAVPYDLQAAENAVTFLEGILRIHELGLGLSSRLEQ